MSSPVKSGDTRISEIRCLRRQLEQEIDWLQRRTETLDDGPSENEALLKRTYNGMIFSRRALLGRMPR
ncbi:hypothetical protein [Microbulbifer sp. GL-2]|uniref:hypothetical protein n=1 Tax=Microbulbifer sp. GL-2 TaxID=2591606 RepID=UPI001162CCF3|nr:hypothetical protein [Microbulbifer sp. GL-2]BBM01552.1 hypothetical protein GL2_16260 [Microbulbifer sp. GL-2]